MVLETCKTKLNLTFPTSPPKCTFHPFKLQPIEIVTAPYIVFLLLCLQLMYSLPRMNAPPFPTSWDANLNHLSSPAHQMQVPLSRAVLILQQNSACRQVDHTSLALYSLYCTSSFVHFLLCKFLTVNSMFLSNSTCEHSLSKTEFFH